MHRLPSVNHGLTEEEEALPLTKVIAPGRVVRDRFAVTIEEPQRAARRATKIAIPDFIRAADRVTEYREFIRPLMESD